MTSSVEILQVDSVLLAVTETRVRQAEIPGRIRGQFDIVYSWLRTSAVEQTGHNYAIYDQFTKAGMRMRVGFPISARFEASNEVSCVELPGGRTVHTTHIGPYHQLHAAHTRLNDWCARNAVDAGGMSWEVYGDWNEDESKLVTDIYVLLD
jgi:effector-binding domain-containing protein